MPHRQCVQSLKTCTLAAIVKDMDSYWCKHRPPASYIYVIGPFEYLPHRLCKEIIDQLIEKQQLKLHHLQLLIDSQTTDMDLGINIHTLASCNRDLLGKLIAIRCKEMHTLSLSHLDQITVPTLLDIVSSLTNLTTLNLASTQSNDNVVLTVAKYLNQLEDFDIRSCKVSDRTLRALVPSTQFTGCPRLRRLNLDLIPDVTVDCISYLLLNLSELEVLKHVSVCDAIFDICLEQSNVRTAVSFHLMHLYYDQSEVSWYGPTNPQRNCQDVLKSAATACLNVTQLDLALQSQEQSDLSSILGHFYALQDLTLSGIEDFGASVLPLLQIHGEHLRTLSFNDVTGINLAKIIGYCVNLCKLFIHLELNNNIALGVTFPGDEALNLPFLQQISITGLNEDTVPGDRLNCAEFWLQCLLSSPLLTSVHFHKVTVLTDQIFRNLIDTLDIKDDTMPFSHLEELICMDCPNVTIKPFKEFVNCRFVPLKKLHMLDCFKISTKDFNAIKKIVQKRRYDLELLYT